MELGKVLASMFSLSQEIRHAAQILTNHFSEKIQSELDKSGDVNTHDASTSNLINIFKKKAGV